MNAVTAQQPTPERQIIAASFREPDAATRAAAAIAASFSGRIGNTAVLTVRPDGTPKFVETKDWGAGRGALVGGAIGPIGGPLGVLAGSGLGVLATKLRDAGFDDDQLRLLGSSLGSGWSAVVVEIGSDAVTGAHGVLESLTAQQVAVVPLNSNIADVFLGEPAPGVDEN